MSWRAIVVTGGLLVLVAACGRGAAQVTLPPTTQAAATTAAPNTTAAPTSTEAATTTRAPTEAPGYSDYGEVEVERPTTTVAGETAAGITIAGFSFGEPLIVSTGEVVTVRNEDRTGHTWTSDDGLFDSGTLAQGEEFDFTFDEAGEYGFHCTIHATMTGTITVTG